MSTATMTDDRAPRLAHSGVVRAVAGGRAVIAVATEGCANCAKKTGCGIGKLAGGRRETLIEVAAADGIVAGDPVRLEIPAERLVGAALLGYLVPSLSLLVGAGLGNFFGDGDAAAAGGSLLGFALGLALTRLFGRGLTAVEVHRL